MRLSGAESVMGKHGKLKVYTLFNRKPMKIFKNTRRVYVLSESVTGNDSGKCILASDVPLPYSCDMGVPLTAAIRSFTFINRGAK